MTTQNHLVFPTDFSDQSLQALAWVERLADKLGAEVHIVYVVEEPHFVTGLELGAAAIPSTADIASSARASLNRLTDKISGKLSRKPKANVLIGYAPDEIRSYAAELGAAMIVMATHGHRGAKRLLLGSTTEAVLRQATCPVVAVPCQ